jgi:hypothetical protein
MMINTSLSRLITIYYPVKRIWLVVLAGIFSTGCHNDLETSLNGYRFERFQGADTQAIEPGKIVLYKYFVSETKVPFPAEEKMVSSQFRMVSPEELGELKHPVFDVLSSMRLQDTVCIHYEKDPLKKYPPEYGDGKMAYLWVTITDVLSEEDIVKREQEKREGIMKDRENYFAQLSNIDSLVKQMIIRYQQGAVSPDTVWEEGFLLFVISKNNSISGYESKQAVKGDVLRLNYAGYDDAGNRIFSSYESREPYITSPGSPKIPPGWTKVIYAVPAHQAVICRIPSRYLYADKGFKGNVQVLPDADLWFYFEYEIVEKGKK